MTPWIFKIFSNRPSVDVLDPELLTIFTSFILSPNSPIVDINSLAADGSEGINSPSFTIDENHIRSSVYNRLTAVQDSTSNLNITLDTLATRILLCQGSDGPTAYGVEIAPGAALPVAGNFEGKQDLTVRSVMARHEVIVSAGVFQSPQLVGLVSDSILVACSIHYSSAHGKFHSSMLSIFQS
jgi:choline dehydrogenase